MTSDEGDRKRYSLTKEEKLLLEEYKLGEDAYYRSESEYSSRENFFIVAEGIIVAAAVQAVKESSYLVAILICLFGITLSLIWFFMQARSYTYSKARLDRLKEIEMMLAFNKDPNIRIFAFATRCEEIRETGYLFTIKDGLEADLDKKDISDGLKNAFARHGHPLSEKAKKTNKWKIMDGDRKYSINDENGELKVRVEPKINHWWEKMSTWKLRKSIPLIFLILWILIFILIILFM